MRVVCISDTHGQIRDIPGGIPDGDVLIVAGDICLGTEGLQLDAFGAHMRRLPHKHKILVAGNHDWGLFNANTTEYDKLMSDVTYLQDSSVVVDGLRFYGSPWQPEFCEMAFNLPRGRWMAEIWSQIPTEVDVLITHTPPHSILDTLPSGQHVGCGELRREFRRIRPKLHVFGHVHSGYGQMEEDGTIYVNAALCGAGHQLVNSPIVVDI